MEPDAHVLPAEREARVVDRQRAVLEALQGKAEVGVDIGEVDVELADLVPDLHELEEPEVGQRVRPCHPDYGKVGRDLELDRRHVVAPHDVQLLDCEKKTTLVFPVLLKTTFFPPYFRGL